MRKFALLFLLLLAACSPTPNGDYSAIRESFEGDDENYFLLGNATIGAENDLPKRVISQSEFGQMSCLANAGYLRSTVNPDDDEKVETEMTPKGEQVSRAFRDTATSKAYLERLKGLDLFKIRLSRTTIDKVMSDREIRKESGRYRIVEFTVASAPSSDAKPYFTACPSSLGATPTQWNARTLLKWDPAKSKWVVKVSDSGTGMFGYDTDNVDAALKGL